MSRLRCYVSLRSGIAPAKKIREYGKVHVRPYRSKFVYFSFNTSDMSETTINIYGGSNQIMDHATQGVQNFYGDQFAETALRRDESAAMDELNDEELRLYTYVQHVGRVKRYVRMLSESKNTKEVAAVVKLMLNEPGVTPELVVTADFIEKLLPFAVRIRQGSSVINSLRVQINNQL